MWNGDAGKAWISLGFQALGSHPGGFPHNCGFYGLLCWGSLAFALATWTMHTSGLWFPLRLRSLNYKGCRAKAGTVQKDISTLKIKRAGGKAVSLRAMENVITTMPGQDSPEFTAPSHTVQTEKSYASFSPLKLQRFQMPYPSVKHFWNYGVGESALSILLFINCLQLFSMPQYPPSSENQGERWQSKGQHRKHQEARKARSAGKYCFILFLQPLISMLKGSMWAEMLYFAFYTETMELFATLLLMGNSPVRF